MTREEILALITAKLAGQGSQVDVGGVIPQILEGIVGYIDGKQDKLTFDNVPTENSGNPVKSGGVYSAVEASKYIYIAKNPAILTVNSPFNPTVLIESELGCALDDLMKVGHARNGTDDNPYYYTVSGGLFTQQGRYSGNIIFINDKTVFLLSLMAGYLVERTIFELRATDATLASNSINPIQNKAVYNALTNYYLKSETYSRAEVQALISAISQFRYELANSLPTASAETMGIIYLVPSPTQSQNNIKDEYITIESDGVYTWEQIGSTKIDLSEYVTTTALNTALAAYTTTAVLNQLLAAKQDTLTFDDAPTAGSNNPVKSSGIKAAFDGVGSSISAAIEGLTLMSDAAFISGDTGLSVSDAAEALGISVAEFNSLLNGDYFYFAYGFSHENRLAVTKAYNFMGGDTTMRKLHLGNDDVVITYNPDSGSVSISSSI